MKFKAGMNITTDPTGPHLGRRKGIIVRMSKTQGKEHLPALIRYTDYPTGQNTDAWVAMGLKTSTPNTGREN